jgi:hypothetical protein
VPGERAHPRFQFGQRKRFGHVVVGTQVQPLDPLLDGVGGGQDQHRRRVAARAQLAQHLQPGQLGQAEVEDHEVEVVRDERGVGLGATGHMVHRVTGAAQRAQQAVGQHLVVLGYQDAHALLSPSLILGSVPPHPVDACR